MTARGEVAQQIKTDQPAWTVEAWPYLPTQVGKGKIIVAVWRSDLNPAPDDFLAHEVTINLYGAKAAEEAAETELDGALDEVLLSLQRLDFVTFKTATRQEFDGGVIAGWQITATLITTNTYKQALLEGN